MLGEPISNITLASFCKNFCLDSMMSSYSEDQISFILTKKEIGSWNIHPTQQPCKTNPAIGDFYVT